MLEWLHIGVCTGIWMRITVSIGKISRLDTVRNMGFMVIPGKLVGKN